jgi:hypothetical protein
MHPCTCSPSVHCSPASLPVLISLSRSSNDSFHSFPVASVLSASLLLLPGHTLMITFILDFFFLYT